MLEAVYINSCYPGCQRLFMRGFRFLSFYYSSLYSNRRAYTVLDHWSNSFKNQMFGGLKCHLWTHLERISCYVSKFRSERCVDVARRDNCRLQQCDYYSRLFYSVLAKTTISNFRQVGTWPLSLAIPKTWPMCSHWPYRGECHIFLWLKASLGVEIGGTASRERNRETTASGGREGKHPFSPFSSSVFFLRSGSYFAPLPAI